MNMRKKTSKSSLFLIELMIAVLFFALCAGVCLSMFAAAHQMSVGSSELTHALNAVQQGAECIKEDKDLITELLQGTELEENTYVVYYDSDWNIVTDQALMSYEMSIIVLEETPMLTAQIQVSKSGTDIYGIEVKKYYGGE